MSRLVLCLLCVAMTVPAIAAEPARIPRDQASAFARLALKGIQKEYPSKPEHVLGGPADVKGPKALHPAFYGSFDWHSSVHGHWMLVRLLRLVPALPEAKEIRRVINEHLTAANLKVEADYFARPESRSFERPYGWAWLLKLAEELHGWDDPDGKAWAANLKPLADLIARRYRDYFPKQTYPIRSGVHANTAFGLAFAHDYARAVGDAALRELVEERARAYYAKDADVPAAWEPGGADFFSPSLMEADLMRRVLPADEFRAWFRRFLPGAARAAPRSLFEPATVTDRSDPQLVHLDGLNLSRAWGMRSVAAVLPKDDPARKALAESAARHAEAGLKHVYGSFDWHSSVHGHWMLVRLLRLVPELPEAKEIRGVLNEHLTAANLKAEADYFARPESRSFERPYGWAWLLKLAEELRGWDDPDGKAWAANLKPLADLIARRYRDYFPKQTYPIRSGVHANTAFGLAFAHDYARAVGDAALRELVEERARAYYAKDADVPAAWEPGGADFFSPSLMEADLMRRVLPADEFRAWFRRFLPGAARAEPRSLFEPATVTDRSDPQLVHLDGLNLSRAWGMRSVAAVLPKDDPARKALAESAARHAEAGLKHVASGDYAGEHWLASFAVYLLTGPAE